ncbi:MAG TPA: hypothetical protein VMH02_03030 [Verrucomicrobiae bacterium]|nr:hypothetical protein [Verrucomicrobiae bacterium]
MSLAVFAWSFARLAAAVVVAALAFAAFRTPVRSIGARLGALAGGAALCALALALILWAIPLPSRLALWEIDLVATAAFVAGLAVQTLLWGGPSAGS